MLPRSLRRDATTIDRRCLVWSDREQTILGFVGGVVKASEVEEIQLQRRRRRLR